MSELLLTYYGDDFTGSTDALEALAANGVSAVLFLRLPGQEDLARFPGCRAVGLAGVSRSKSPAWMSENLPSAFRRLKELGAPLCQYKVCSTFDSSPEIGSIGRALEIGRQVFGNPCAPVVVGCPALGRYVLFGHLFARDGAEVYRIDRHPTMSRHPVTPMLESDLGLHLSRQTELRIGLVDILALRAGKGESKWEALLREGFQVAVFDGLDEDLLVETGRILWTRPVGAQMFVVGSSGLDYALMAYWRAAGLIPEPPEFPDPGPVDRLVVISGSCSPVTEKQLRWAIANGFVGVPLEPQASFEGPRSRALESLSAGRSVALYTALGPGDRRDGVSAERLGERLGVLLREIVERCGLRRAVLAGGDTAGYAARQLGVYALTLLRPLDPGAPLCRAHADEARWDGLELVLKGGQIGKEDFFSAVCRGKR